MILEITDTLVDVIHQATPDLGTWVVLRSPSLECEGNGCVSQHRIDYVTVP
jgi:hypothetical protein